jgi:hypothetical protein
VKARVVIGWAVVALVGLVLAACISFAASQLSSQHVGLSGEPLSAGKGLAPHAQSGLTTTRSTPETSQPPATRPERNDGGEHGEASDGDD